MMNKVAENNQQDERKGQPDADSIFFNVVQSAIELGVHPGTIRKAISDKRLKSTRLYGRVVVSRAELERYRTETYPNSTQKRGRPGSAADAPPKDA